MTLQLLWQMPLFALAAEVKLWEIDWHNLFSLQIKIYHCSQDERGLHFIEGVRMVAQCLKWKEFVINCVKALLDLTQTQS